jgi:hypothetical protein
VLPERVRHDDYKRNAVREDILVPGVY